MSPSTVQSSLSFESLSEFELVYIYIYIYIYKVPRVLIGACKYLQIEFAK